MNNLPSYIPDTISAPSSTPTPAITQQPSPFKKYLSKVPSVLLTLWGIYGIARQTQEIFFVYPHLPELFANSDYDLTLFRELAFKTLILSSESFATSLYGFGMMIKPGHGVKLIHHIIALLIGIGSVAIRFYFTVPEETIESIRLIAPHL